ncbi:tRNA epoxyqueuosine(34) reductase QueG [Membranihabitans marinus]|uniref:tRNA epoxyqueuosine(34) reductase QueG n=1 Tax=Membranihabitans marinus TaxID=1227546 RepID=UPI001F030DC0|nr:tRNA epoxyqueuosine(34) reductase QueG [Membranihabitans marinus]
MDVSIRTQKIREKALDLGFSLVGFVQAEPLTYEKIRLQNWLDKGYHGEMTYMENYFDKRTDPTLLVPGCKSIIVLAYNYHNPQKQIDPTAPKISQYAYGKDYHYVVKDKLKILEQYIHTEIHPIEARVFVDSAPVMEREWAKKAGIGWMGKNTLIINPKKGSYFFLGEILLNIDLEYDQAIGDYCGTCTRCIDACPTDAIQEQGYEMDGSRCISYATIELKGEIPKLFEGKMENWAFGCDICQDVCPWNRFAQAHGEQAFLPSEEVLNMTQEDWNELTETEFNKLFKKSPLKRTKFKGIKRNLEFLK